MPAMRRMHRSNLEIKDPGGLTVEPGHQQKQGATGPNAARQLAEFSATALSGVRGPTADKRARSPDLLLFRGSGVYVALSFLSLPHPSRFSTCRV